LDGLGLPASLGHHNLKVASGYSFAAHPFERSSPSIGFWQEAESVFDWTDFDRRKQAHDIVAGRNCDHLFGAQFIDQGIDQRSARLLSLPNADATACGTNAGSDKAANPEKSRTGKKSSEVPGLSR
jgi:hypothetical protein